MPSKEIPSKEELLKIAEDVIPREGVIFLKDLYIELDISQTTFDKIFPTDSEEKSFLLQLIKKERISQKKKLRKDWKGSLSATLQIALYKLLADKEELDRLNNQAIEEQAKKIAELVYKNGNIDGIREKFNSLRERNKTNSK